MLRRGSSGSTPVAAMEGNRSDTDDDWSTAEQQPKTSSARMGAATAQSVSQHLKAAYSAESPSGSHRAMRSWTLTTPALPRHSNLAVCQSPPSVACNPTPHHTTRARAGTVSIVAMAAAALTVAPHVVTHRLQQHFERRGERVEIAGTRRRLQTARMQACATVCARGTTADDLAAHLQHLPLVPEDQ